MSSGDNGRLLASAMRSWCLALCLGCWLVVSAVAQVDEQAAIRHLAEAYFAAYQQENLEGLMSLWSAQSPDVATTRQSLQQTFADTEQLAVNIVQLGTAKVEVDKAKIRIDVEISAVDVKTGKPAAGIGRLHRTLALVKEEGVWRVWRSVASEDDFASALVAAKTDEARAALLAAEKELVTIELRRALVKQGQQFSSQANYEQALMAYQLALQIGEQLGDKTGVAEAAQHIGAIHYFQGDYTTAFEYCQKSLRLAEETGDKALMAQALGSIALVYSFQSNYTLAFEYYRQSLKLAEEIGDKGMIARVLNNTGNAYQSRGDHAQALDYYQRSRKLAEELADKGGLATTLGNIGAIHYAQGSYAQALAYHRKSLKLAEEAGDEMLLASALDSLGIVHTAQGDYAQALAYHRRSLKLAEAMADEGGRAITLGNIGSVYEAQGNYTQALTYYRQSLKLAEEVGDKEWMVTTLKNIGNVYEAQGNYAQTVKLADRALYLAKQTGDLEGLWAARTTAGKAYRALNQPEQARLAFADAIATIERLRDQVVGGEQERQLFFENKLVPYKQMVALLIAQNNPAEALAYAERAKGRVLLDVLRNGRANITRAMTAKEQVQERQLNSELVTLNSQRYHENLKPQPDPMRLTEFDTRLRGARLEYESFRTSLYAAHPELKVQRGETPPLTLNQAAELLPPDGNTALLEYVVADDNSFLFVLTQAAPAHRQKPTAVTLKVYPLNINSKELSGLVETFQQRLGERNLAFNAHAQRLYDLLLKPAHAQLRTKDTLCIVPDGVLWQLPFQALKPTARRYLIEDQAIFYAPSLTTLREMIKPRKQASAAHAPSAVTPTLLAFGNPLLNPQTVARQQAVYRAEELGALPEAEKEVNALRELYGAARSRVYVGAAAREELAKSATGNYRVVHFATHGILDNRSPLYSHLLLAQDTNNSVEDGLLEAREIMELDLQTELVVLSACQTAGGRVGAGEGVIGMTWALFVAGCPTTLVSQWKVDTRSTAKLMVEFHSNLQRQRQWPLVIRKAEALRQAMLTLLRSEEYELP